MRIARAWMQVVMTPTLLARVSTLSASSFQRTVSPMTISAPLGILSEQKPSRLHEHVASSRGTARVLATTTKVARPHQLIVMRRQIHRLNHRNCLTWKGFLVLARTSASHFIVVPGGTVERMTKMGGSPVDCSTSLTTNGMVDHTYCVQREEEGN